MYVETCSDRWLVQVSEQEGKSERASLIIRDQRNGREMMWELGLNSESCGFQLDDLVNQIVSAVDAARTQRIGYRIGR